MAMVGVDSGNLQADSQLMLFGSVWGSSAAWRHCTFIKWTGWTLAMALPWWQHHKHCLGIVVAWKPILYWLFVTKNQSFRNKSGKPQPIRTKFGIHGHVKGWQRSGNFRRDRSILGKMGAGTSPAEREFFVCGNPSDLSAISQRPIFTKFGHETYLGVPSRNPERQFRKFSL